MHVELESGFTNCKLDLLGIVWSFMEFLPYDDLCKNNKIVDLQSPRASGFKMVPFNVRRTKTSID